MKKKSKTSFWERHLNTNKGSIELLHLLLPTLLSFMGALFLIKSTEALRGMKDTSDLYLCAKQTSVNTQKHFKTQVRLNQTILALKLAAAVKAVPLIEAIRKAALLAAKIAQEVKFKEYQLDMAQIPYCGLRTKLQFLTKYPFKNNGLTLKRRAGLLILRKKSWTIAITPRNLKSFKTLEGKWKAKKNLSTYSEFTYQKKAAPLLASSQVLEFF